MNSIQKVFRMFEFIYFLGRIYFLNTPQSIGYYYCTDYSRGLDSMESPTWEVYNGEILQQKPILPGWR